MKIVITSKASRSKYFPTEEELALNELIVTDEESCANNSHLVVSLVFSTSWNISLFEAAVKLGILQEFGSPIRKWKLYALRTVTLLKEMRAPLPQNPLEAT